MRSPSIRRSLGLGLVGLAVALAVVAVLGIAGLYQARQEYEDAQARAYELQTSSARLLAAGVLEESSLRRTDPGAAAARARAARSFDAESRRAATLARGDARSAVLLGRRVDAEERGRRLGVSKSAPVLRRAGAAFAQGRRVSAALGIRQTQRRAEAREAAAADTRQALITALIAGVLAMLAALALVVALVRSMRDPLDKLVGATRRVARGERSEPLEPAGPRELQQLGDAFNRMSADLDGARDRVEAERLRLAVTVESLGDALVACDAHGRITLLNPRAEDLFPDLSVGDDAEAPDSPLPPLGDALTDEVSLEVDGRTLAITAAPLGGPDEGTVWTVRDISERARLERLKSEFVATASHELRSPLTSIKGFVELLARSKNLGKREREWAEVILLSTNRLVDLVNDLLDVARVEAGRLEITRRPTDVAEIAEEVATLMKPRVDDKDQELRLDLPTGLPRAVADPSRLRQILSNLLTNAHLYTDVGGTLIVRASAERNTVRVQVEDTGRGMGGAELEQVFERFYRGGDGHAGQPGTGLGLSIVKSLVDLQGGTIEVESELGVGTTFTVRMPREPAAGEDGAPRLALQGRRVLVVDDEPDIAQLIASQLAPFEVETVIAGSGAEALELLRSDGRFDAVTLDILMPRMSGVELLRTVRADPGLRRTPVVVVSVSSGRQALAGEWTVGKPIDALELADALGSAVLAGRTSVLVVGRSSLQSTLEPMLARAGLDHEWVTSGAAAARACEERRYELALVDAGMRSPRAVLQALDLRGRRQGRGVVVFSSGASGDVARLGPEAVPIEDATAAVIEMLRSAE